MNKPLLSVLTAAVVIGLSGCTDKPDTTTTTTPSTDTVISVTNTDTAASSKILMQDFLFLN